MTYPQGYTPPPKPKPKHDPRLKPTQSDSMPMDENEFIKKYGERFDRTTMDDHLNDFEKENYSDSSFKKPKGLHLKKYRTDEPFRMGLSHKNKIGFFKKLMLKLKVAEEVKK